MPRLLVLLISFAAPSAHAADRITAETILEIVRKNHVKTVDQLVPLLPEDLRKNFSLVYDSRNTVQHASFQKPRIILTSSDGGFQLALAGDEAAGGGNLVEMITQQPSGKFQFSSLSFAEGVATHDPSPASCVGCHKGRPIWATYPRWAGVYGSDHDKLRRLRLSRSMEKVLSGKDDLEYRMTSREVKELERFLAGPGRDGRYSHLLGLRSAGYGDLANLNMFLSDALERSTNRQIIARILDQDGGEKALPWILKHFNEAHREIGLNPASFEQELGAEVGGAARKEYEAIAGPQRNALDKITDASNAKMNRLHAGFYDGKRLSELFRGYNFASGDQDVYSGLEAIGKALGIEPEFWEPGSIGKTIRQRGGGLHSANELYKSLLEELAVRDPRVARYMTVKPVANGLWIYELADDGMKFLSDPTYRVPRGPVHFSEVPNMYPLRYGPFNMANDCKRLFRSLFAR
jgi:hypothetical protein